MITRESKVDLAVVIVSYNVEALLRKCLQSLNGRLPSGNNAVVIVDNVSRDNSVEMLRKEFPDCALIEEDRNIGFGRATNAGVKSVTADYYLVLNPDTEISNDIIIRMSAHMKRHPEAAVVGCRMLAPTGEIQRCIYIPPTLFSAVSAIFQLKKLLDMKWLASLARGFLWIPLLREYLCPREWKTAWSRVGSVPGSCFLVDGGLWRKLGGFDEKIFLYSEDADLFYRVVRGEGREIHLLQDTGVLHHVGKSFNSRFTEVSPCKYWSTLYYFRKNHGLFHYVVVAFSLFFASLARLVVAYFSHFEDIVRKDKYMRDCLVVMKISIFGLKSFDPFSAID